MNAWTWLEVIGDRVFHASWQATCLVGLVLVLQRLLRHRLTPRWRHALWFPVLIRLALPFTPPSAFSLFQWVPWGGSPAPSVRTASVGPALNPARMAVEPRMAEGSPLPDASAADEAPGAGTFPPPAAREGGARVFGDASPASALSNAPEAKGDPVPRARAASAGNAFSREDAGGLSWGQWLAAGWGLGVLGFLAFSAVGLSRFRARLRQCPQVKDPELLRLWSECQRALEVHREVRLVESTAASGPALFGFRRMWLLLPPGFADRFTVAQRRHVFLHELAHLRRHDIAVHWIMALLQAIHWFNPVIWFAFARVRSAREEAADALALAAGSAGETREYGLTVLQLVEESSRPTRLPGWVGILDEPGQLTERIESIARFRAGGTVSRWPWLLVLILGFVGLTDAPRSAPAAEKTNGAVVAESASTSAPEPAFAWQVITNGPAVRVRVVDAATGQPLEGAEVVAPSPAVVWGFDAPKSARWLTDAAGEVTIHLGIRHGNLPQHEQWFTTSVRRTGFASRGRSWLIPAGVALERVPERTEFQLERGLTVGGVVRDEAARPLAGIRVRLAADGHQYGPPGENDYPEFWQSPEDRDAIVTDAEGRWEVADFPTDLDRVRIECWRPDGMVHRFEGKRQAHSNEESHEQEWGDPIDLSSILDKKATLVLPDGYTVRGRVVDPDGNAVAGARVRAAFGHQTQTLAGETRSDASGRFAFLHRRPIEWILTAEMPGFAVSSVVVTANSNAPEAEIRLGRLDPLRLRVVNSAGMPLPGVEVSVDRNRSGPQVVDFSGTTDSTGTLVWTNAPPGALTFRIQSGNEPVERWVKLAPGERNREVRIRPGPATHVIVTGRAVEEGTDRPIGIGIVGFRAQANPTFSTVELETLEMLGEGRFQLRVPLDWFYPSSMRNYQLRLWAPGVGTVITEFRDFDEGDWDLTARFRRGGAIQGTLRLADGRPASDAVLSASTSRFGILSIRDRGIPAKEAQIQSHADVAGRYGVDDPGSDGPGASRVFVILHPEGFLEIPASRLRENGDVTLLPCGRIEGVLRSERGPVAGELVTLRRDTFGRFNMHWSLHKGTQSGPGGEFVFTNLPPGEYVLNRRFSAAGGPNFESHPVSVRVESGATVRVSYGGEGRTVIGRVRGRPLYWEAATHRLVAEGSLARPPWPDPDRFATAESYYRWMAGFDGMHAWWAQLRIYGVTVERDSSFRAEDVPPGTYDLELLPYDPRSTRPEAPRLRRKVVVPPITEADRGVPLDLGVLEFGPEAVTPPP